MIRLLLTTVFATALLGCGGRSYKVEHPVVGPVPPRLPRERAMAMADTDEAARGQSGDVQLVSTTGAGNGLQPLEMTDVVATVNGRPILVADVLGPNRTKVEAIRKQVSPAQFRQIQDQAIQEQLSSHIEQAMMVSVTKSKLKAEQIKGIETQIDSLFEQQLEQMVADMQKAEDANAAKVGRPRRELTLADLEADVQQQGMTIGVMRKMFGDKALAQQYMLGKLEAAEPVSRPELLAEYQKRIEEFTEPASIKWQQIQVSFRNFESREDAQAHAAAALAELKRGVSFDAVAKKYSDGPDSANGGHWDWTQYSSLLTELQGPLSKLPAGTPSEIIATSSALQIVQVVERRESKTKAFAEVQAQLREELADAKHQARVKEILLELRSQCVVSTIYDEPGEAGPATPAANEGGARPISPKKPEGG